VDQEQKPPERSFIRELVPDWRPTREQVLWAVRITIVLVVLLVILEFIGDYYDKSLWDWATILLVPAVLAIGGYWFNRRQQERDQWNAEQRAQDETLQAYLEQIGQLLLDKDRPLRKAKAGDEVRTLARARTLTTLDLLMLNSEHQRRVLRFLYEMELTRASRPNEAPVISLQFARMPGIDMRRRRLLKGADLRQANMTYADLTGADLTETRLGGAKLIEAKLTDAILTRADLIGAQGVTNADLEAQAKSLEGATMPNGQKYEDWLKSQGRGEDGENSGPS
jgi:hypothetical protein